MSEILAPAGTREALIAAVRSGADAVYFGASDFNARRNAENFTNDDLCSVVSYCHIRGVRAYLTLNTLVCDEELSRAMQLLQCAADAGIDGIIIQDIGLAAAIHAAFPTLPLHASTQMTVHNKSGVEFLHARGYSRVVLARELSFEQLQIICDYAAQIGMQTEIFVHGALCMSMSGQCLLSALLGSRSGNRGLCAGPCRLPFSVQGGSGYDLSLKDLDLCPHLERLNTLGISSYKIEGRMKRPEYVAMAVDAVRTARDGGELCDKLKDLQSIFSRSGFSDGYLTGHTDGEMFGIRSEQDIAESRRIMNSAHELYRRERQSVGVTMHLTLRRGVAMELRCSDDNNILTVIGDTPEPAKTRAVDAEFVKARLDRCGQTPYFISRLTADIDDGLSVSSAALSQLRAKALEQLSELRARPRIYKRCPTPPVIQNERPATARRHQLFVSVHSLEQLPQGISTDMLIIPLASDLQKTKELLQSGCCIAVKTPPAFFEGEQRLLERLREFCALGVQYAVAENVGALPLIASADMKIIGGAGLNCFNSATAAALPCDMLTLSYELTRSQLTAIKSPVPTGIVGYGRIPLMLLACCPRRARVGCGGCDGKITDRMGVEFKLMCEDGATRLLGDRPLYIGDCPAIINSVDFVTLQFTDEPPDEVARIIRLFRRSAAINGDFTRGLYLRGVK